MNGCVVVGLTGQTGAGKSLIRDFFSSQGCYVIDADAVAHQIVDKELNCLVEVAERFSCIILNEQGKLDRRRLGRIVFSDRKQLQTLNKIMFPYITRDIECEAERAAEVGAKIVVIDAAALFESGCDKICDTVISVVARAETRLERIIARDGLSRQDAENRVQAQHEDEYYTERSNFVIVNNADKTDLRLESERVFARISAGDKGKALGAEGKEQERDAQEPEDGQGLVAPPDIRERGETL